jgi:UDP-glucose:(heptosyl)LPS alpha-1,3-glucosyltransferase
VYYGSDPCYAAKVERLKARWYEWLPRYKHFVALERTVFARGGNTHALVLTEREIPHYQRHYGTERERFHLLPPGIERRKFLPAEQQDARARIRSNNGWAPDDLLLLLVGSGFRVKGLDRAIRSLAALPEPLGRRARLVVIGQNRPGEFQLQARRLGVGERVHFLGGRDDVFQFLLAADLLVHPAYSEAAGMVLLEALTAGLPVLCTDVCGYAAHIQRANAGRVLAAPFSQEACDEAMADMLQAEARAAWQRNAVAYAAREDLYSCHETACNVIEQVISAKRR